MWLLTIALTMLLSTSAQANTMLFTDQATFDAAVGQTQLITFDQPVPITMGTTNDPLFGVANIDGLMTYSGDIASLGSNTGIVPGTPGALIDGGISPWALQTINPVYAFGADFTPLSLPTALGGLPLTNLIIGGIQFQIGTPTFLGVIYTDPTQVSIDRVFQRAGLFGSEWSSFALDNIEIKTVPEPSGLMLLGMALLILSLIQGFAKTTAPNTGHTMT